VDYSKGQTYTSWHINEVANILLGIRRKKPKKKHYVMNWYTKAVPVPYARIALQLSLEVLHLKYNEGHEAVRRGCYAARVLQVFGKELHDYRGPSENFRSKAFTPILQRQLRGIPDGYGPVISATLSAREDGKVSINEATHFYLAINPVDPHWIRAYRQNLIYCREARWALLIILGIVSISSAGDYDWSLRNHDKVFDGLAKAPPRRRIRYIKSDSDDSDVPEGNVVAPL